MAMRPRSGVTRPAIMFTTVVLPAPEGPNRAVTPFAVAKRAATVNSPSRVEDARERVFSLFSTSTASMLLSVKAHAGPARQPFGENERHERNRDRDQHQASGGGIAPGRLGVSIDRGRDCLRLARDVGDEGDGCAEFAE